MDSFEKKSFRRQMYANDSEVGRMKLQSVKENLYEAHTKVILHTIEMYAQKDLSQWVQTDLVEKLPTLRSSNDLKKYIDEFEKGNIGGIDITNGSAIINDFLRKEALGKARNQVQAKINVYKNKLEEADEIIESLEQRRLQVVDEKNDYEEGVDVEVENGDTDKITYDENEGDEMDISTITDKNVYLQVVSMITHVDELDNEIERQKEYKKEVEGYISQLENYKRGKQDILTNLDWKESNALNNLRRLRNAEFAHKTEHGNEISSFGKWEPDAGPLYQWAAEIINYLKVIDERYREFAIFDDYYTLKVNKEKFDNCRIYVQRQINELYVNKSNITFEFGGILYDKNDEDFNFKRLIVNMAQNWGTGIRYLTVVSNEDFPELNLFFKECLSGTDNYVDYYLYYRKIIREASLNSDYSNMNAAYFKLLYNLNPDIRDIYWRGKKYTKRYFSRKILKNLASVKDGRTLLAHLVKFNTFLGGFDLLSVCKHHLLSKVYFVGHKDDKGRQLAGKMEKAINRLAGSEKKYIANLYIETKNAISDLMFYLNDEYEFSSSILNKTCVWENITELVTFMEDANNFSSLSQMAMFINELNDSADFAVWKARFE